MSEIDYMWKLTGMLRWERRIHPFDLHSYRVLQQEWFIPATMEKKWTDIPTIEALKESERTPS